MTKIAIMIKPQERPISGQAFMWYLKPIQKNAARLEELRNKESFASLKQLSQEFLGNVGNGQINFPPAAFNYWGASQSTAALPTSAPSLLTPSPPSASWYSGRFHDDRSASQRDTRQKRLPWIFFSRQRVDGSTIFRKGDNFGKTYPQMKTSISFTNPVRQISSQEVIGYNGGNSWEMSDTTVRVEQPARWGIKYEAFVLFLFHSLSQQLRLSIYIMLPSSNGLLKWSSAFGGGGEKMFTVARWESSFMWVENGAQIGFGAPWKFPKP